MRVRIASMARMGGVAKLKRRDQSSVHSVLTIYMRWFMYEVVK